MNHLFLLLHRWVGLFIAGFLVVSGLTGAIISWDHELDELLNPHLTHVESQGPPQPVFDLVSAIEARDQRARVTFVPLAPEQGDSLAFGIDPLVDPATGRLYELGYNQVFIDPSTGQNWADGNGEPSGRSRKKPSCPFCISCTIRCTFQKCGASTGGACGSWAALPFYGQWTVSSAFI